MEYPRIAPLKVVGGLSGAIFLSCAMNAALSILAQGHSQPGNTLEGLRPAAYLPLTTMGVLGSATAWSIIRSRARRPNAVLRQLIPSVVGLSLLPCIWLFLVHAEPIGVVALMLMHFVVAAVSVPVLRLTLPLRPDLTTTRRSTQIGFHRSERTDAAVVNGSQVV